MSTNRDPLVERVAEALGELPSSYNRFDYTDEAETWIHAPVDELAAAVLDALPELAQAQAAVEPDPCGCGETYPCLEASLCRARYRAALAGPEPTDPEQEV